MRRIGRAECLSFVFYIENYGRGHVTVDDKGNTLDKPRNYPASREELIMNVNDVFKPHGIMIGLHDDNPPDKDHEHWYLGFENSRFQPSDFEPLAYDLGFVVKPALAYMNRPDTLDDYIKHVSDNAKKDGKKVYDDSHIWKSEYWDPQLYMSADTKKDIKREQRETETSTMDVNIITMIDGYNIRYFPELLDYLQKYPALYNYVLMQRSSFYFMYLRELRECDKVMEYRRFKEKYPHGTNSVDAGQIPPKNDDVPDPGCAAQEVPFMDTSGPEPEQPVLPEVDSSEDFFEIIGPDGDLDPFE